MLQNAYFLAKIGADIAENEQHFAEILPKTGNYTNWGFAPVRVVGIRSATAWAAATGWAPRVAASSTTRRLFSGGKNKSIESLTNNFERFVLGCTGANLCKQILVGKLLTRFKRFPCVLWEKRTEIENEIMKIYENVYWY